MATRETTQRRLIECFHETSDVDVAKSTVVADPRARIAVSQVFLDPRPLVKCYQERLQRKRGGGSTFIKERFFNYSLKIRESEESDQWMPFDPKFSHCPYSDWQTLTALLNAADRKLFTPVATGLNWNNFAMPERMGLYQSMWTLETSSAEPSFVCSRRKLMSKDPLMEKIFDKLGDYDGTLEPFPRALQVGWLNRLNPCVAVNKHFYPAQRLIDDLIACLEQTVLLHYYLFFRLIDAIVKDYICYHPQDIIPSHLVPAFAVEVSRERLYATVQQTYPDFHPPRIIEKATLTRGEEQTLHEQWQKTAATGQTAQGQAVDAAVDPQSEQLQSLSFDPELDRFLRLIKCELHFVRYGVNGGVSIAHKLDAELAVTIAQVVPDLSRTWSAVPAAHEVDYKDFWLKKVWNVSRDGRSRSSCSTTSFRYALYDPPYGGATDWLIAEVETTLFELIFGATAPEDCYRIFAVDTKCSSYFINEWWDYLWVAAHKDRPEIMVIYGSTTD